VWPQLPDSQGAAAMTMAMAMATATPAVR